MHELSALELHKKFINKEASAVEIATHFLDRIEKLDPKLSSFISFDREAALGQAKNLDEKLARGEDVGKMAGVPVAIKDNIHVKGMISTCASNFLRNYRAPFDSTAAYRLKEAGAIILGKTNCDEFAMGSSTENSAIQKTKNPWHLDCVPGGSSGGSAAACSAELAAITLGSDTGGSIRQPASFCGVVGFKPTYGKVSRYGLVAYGSSLDVVGPFAKSVADVAYTMETIGGHCANDSTSLPGEAGDFLQKLDEPVGDLTIGVPWSFLEKLSEEPRKIFEDSLKKLTDQGAKLVDVDLDILKYSLSVYYILATAEASTNLARFDGIRYGVRAEGAKTLDEVYELSKELGYGKEVKRRILLGTFVLSSGYQDAYYRKAQKVRTLMINKYKEAFRKCRVIASPVTPFSAFKLDSKHDPIQMYLEDIYTIGINLGGLPAVSVPSAFTKENKPMGLQIIGPHRADADVLSVAHHFEKINAINPKRPDWIV